MQDIYQQLALHHFDGRIAEAQKEFQRSQVRKLLEEQKDPDKIRESFLPDLLLESSAFSFLLSCLQNPEQREVAELVYGMCLVFALDENDALLKNIEGFLATVQNLEAFENNTEIMSLKTVISMMS